MSTGKKSPRYSLLHLRNSASFFFSFLCSSHTWTYFSCKHTTDGIPGHALVRKLVIFVVWCSYVCCKLFVLGKGDYIFVMVCVSGEFPQLYSPGAN